MSDTLDLGALRALVEAMMPGPWRTSAAPHSCDITAGEGDDEIHIARTGHVENGPRQDPDAAGIVALRNSADALLSRLEAAEGRVAALTAALGEAHGGYDGRVQDIANENFGPFPVQSPAEAMDAIERGIFEQRQRIGALEVALREALGHAGHDYYCPSTRSIDPCDCHVARLHSLLSGDGR